MTSSARPRARVKAASPAAPTDQPAPAKAQSGKIERATQPAPKETQPVRAPEPQASPPAAPTPSARTQRRSERPDVLAQAAQHDHVAVTAAGVLHQEDGELMFTAKDARWPVHPSPGLTVPEAGPVVQALLWPRTDETGLVTTWTLGRAKAEGKAASVGALRACGTLTGRRGETFTLRVTPSKAGSEPFEVTFRATGRLVAALPKAGGRLVVHGRVVEGTLHAVRFHPEQAWTPRAPQPE